MIERAIVDIVQEIGKVRNTYLKLQQAFLEIDETNVDGKVISESDIAQLDL